MHFCRSVLDLLENNNIYAVFVPGGCTGELQPLDLSVKNEYKRLLRECFTSWYAEKIRSSMQSGVSIDDLEIDLKMSTMKPIHARFLQYTVDIMYTILLLLLN